MAADWTLCIAPEFDNHLARCCQAVTAAGGNLLGPSLEVVELASNKQRTSDHLSQKGVPVARGRMVAAGQPLPLLTSRGQGYLFASDS